MSTTRVRIADRGAEWLLASVLVALHAVVSFAICLRIDGGPRWVLFGVLNAIVIATVFGFVGARRSSSLSLRESELIFRSFGRSRVVMSRSSPGRVVRVRVEDFRRPDVQLWFDAEGVVRATFIEAAWDVDDLAALRDQVGVPIEQDQASTSRAELFERYPELASGTVRWLLRGSNLVWLVLVFILLFSIAATALS